jgi:hypothetical protein
LVGKPEGRNLLEDPGVDVKILLKWILGREIWSGLDSSQDGDQWWFLANTVMNLRVP